jgi:hypothetical protein
MPKLTASANPGNGSTGDNMPDNAFVEALGVPALLDSRSTRRRRKCAGRDGKMLAAKPKDYPKEEDRMRSDQIP